MLALDFSDLPTAFAFRPHLSIPELSEEVWMPESALAEGRFGDFKVMHWLLRGARVKRLRRVYGGIGKIPGRTIARLYGELWKNGRIVMERESMVGFAPESQRWTSYVARSSEWLRVRIPRPVQQIIELLESDGLFERLVVVMVSIDQGRCALFGTIGRRPCLVLEWATISGGLDEPLEEVCCHLMLDKILEGERRDKEEREHLQVIYDAAVSFLMRKRLRRMGLGVLIAMLGGVVWILNSYGFDPGTVASGVLYFLGVIVILTGLPPLSRMR